MAVRRRLPHGHRLYRRHSPLYAVPLLEDQDYMREMETKELERAIRNRCPRCETSGDIQYLFVGLAEVRLATCRQCRACWTVMVNRSTRGYSGKLFKEDENYSSGDSSAE